MNAETGWIRQQESAGATLLSAGGEWSTGQLAGLAKAAQSLVADCKKRAGGQARLDLSAIDYLDSGGAWLVEWIARQLRDTGFSLELSGAKPSHQALLNRAARAAERHAAAEPPPKHNPLLYGLAQVGEPVVEGAKKARELLSFFGLSIILLGQSLAKPWRVHFRACVVHIEQTGLNAMPIVGLLAFLIGMVIAFMGAVQLKKFGAEIFTVNLVGVAVLRELGVLITAILIAGRSGSAFTAQIGTMRVNQEIDAMITIGLNPVEVLVLPRVFAMFITLPLLTFYADIMGLAGGAVISMTMLGIPLEAFVRQLSSAVDMTTFLIGVLKAPVFAYLIALVGCFEGMQVSGSAESVGKRTTMSVVEAIFLVIAVDAFVAIGLSILDI